MSLNIWIPRILLLMVVACSLGVQGLASTTIAESTQTASTTDESGTFLYLPLITEPNKFVGVGGFIFERWIQDLDTFVSQTGKPHSVYLVGIGWECPWVYTVSQVRSLLDGIHQRGATPLISWMPFDCKKGGFGDIEALNLTDILNGSKDSYIQEWANDINALGYPVFVRWGHEMNIPSYSWAGQHAFGTDGKTDYDRVTEPCGLTNCFISGDPTITAFDGPERYIMAYRHIYNIVTPLAPNVVWVWNPNGKSWPLPEITAWNSYENYYPGDHYVDWVGVDAYNWGDQSLNGYGHWVTFGELFHAVLNDMASLWPNKLQMIPEMSSVEDPYDPNRKANWIRDAYTSAYYNYPLLKIVCWDHERFWDSSRQPPGYADFRVTSSPQALKAYQDSIVLWSSFAPLR